MEETKSVYLNDDLPFQVNQQRADMRAIVENAQSKNVPAKVIGNKVQVANKTYKYRDLHLPNGLKLANAKTKVTAKGLAFQGGHSIYSNFYPTHVLFNGRNFMSAEHAYQFEKALFFGDNTAAAEIFHAQRPQDAKRHGAKLGLSRDWDQVKVARMTDIVQSKFSQNKRLGAELLKSSPALLIEATFDTFWGAGLPLSSKELVNGNWQGRNNMGLILVNCRTELNRELVAGRWTSPHLDVPLNQAINQMTPYGGFPAVNHSYQRPVPSSQQSYPAQPVTEIKQSTIANQQFSQGQMQSYPNMSFPPPPVQSFSSQGIMNANQSYYPTSQTFHSS